MAQLLKTLLLGLLVVLAQPAQAQEVNKFQPAPKQARVRVPETVPAYMKLAAIYYGQKDYGHFLKVMQKLAQMAPNDPDIQFRLATAYALNNDKKNAFNTLLQLSNLGVSYDLNGEDFDNIKGYGLYRHVTEAFEINARPRGDYDPVMKLDDTRWVIDGMAWNPLKKRLLLGSVMTGQVLEVDTEKKRFKSWIRPNRKKGLQSVHDLAVDARHKRLWLSSNPGKRFRNPEGVDQPMLFAFRLKNGRFLSRHPLPNADRPHNLGAVTVDDAGNVYVVDRLARAIYWLPKEKQKNGTPLQLLVALPLLEGMSGIAWMPDSGKLYVSDSNTGVVLIDREKHRSVLLKTLAPLVTTGIERLYAVPGRLIAVQSSMSPQRIMRYDLNEAGDTIRSLKTLVSGQPELKLPMAGAVVGPHFYFAANAQWTSQAPVEIARVVIGEPEASPTPTSQPKLGGSVPAKPLAAPKNKSPQ